MSIICSYRNKEVEISADFIADLVIQLEKENVYVSRRDIVVNALMQGADFAQWKEELDTQVDPC